MENLKAIIKEIQSYNKELGLKATDNQILDTAGRIFNTQFINENKQGKKDSVLPPFSKNDSSLATKKQIYFLKKNGYDGDLKSLTKQEAIRIIEEMKR